MKKHVQIKYSYDIWNPKLMLDSIYVYCVALDKEAPLVLQSEFYSKVKRPLLLIIEWWLHNIGYYLTKPFIFIPPIKSLNERFEHVDLMIKFKGEET